MVIQTKIHDGIKLTTRTWRDVVRGRSYAQFIDGFYAQGQYCKSGIMTELRGLKRIKLASFGKVEL